MAEHRAEQVMTAVADLIKAANTSAGKHVYRWAALPLPAMPFAIEIGLGADEPESFLNNSLIDSWLNIHVDLYTTGQQYVPRTDVTSAEYETNLFTLRKEIHIALMADVTQGLSFVIDTDPLGAQEPTINGEGEQVSVMMRTDWRIKYRTSLTDPST